MAKITEDMNIQEGSIYGYVRTDVVGSQCEFEICSVDEWKKMSESEAEKCAQEALHESGVMEWGW